MNRGEQKSGRTDGRARTIANLAPEEVMLLLDKHFPEAKTEIGPIEILSCGQGRAVIRLPYEQRFARPGGTISGPTMFKMADMGCYVAIIAALGETAIDAVTTTLTINFLARPALEDLLGEVEIMRLGRRQAVCDARIFGASGHKLVAQASSIYALPLKT